MPYSAGVFQRLFNWVQEALASPIEIAKLDASDDDVATALTNCILRDGTGVPTADTPWNNKKLTGLAAATADTDAVSRVTGDARWLPLALTRRSIPTSSTTLATDVGRGIVYTGNGDTLTCNTNIPDNGTVIVFNAGLSALTISASGTLFWMGGAGTFPSGSRLLAVGGVAYLLHSTSGNYYVWGWGLS